MSTVLQLILNGLMAGSMLALPAIALTTIFVIRRYMNFALAGHMALGAYAGYVVNVQLGLSTFVAFLVAFIVAGLAGVATDHIVLRPLARLGALTISVGSIALNLFLENLVRFIFGNGPHSYDVPLLRDWHFGMLRVGPQQVTDLIIAAVVMAGLFFFLLVFPTGKAMRAVGDNPNLADIKGIDPERMGRYANFVAMGLAGVGGMLFGLETTLDPEMGTRIMLSVFAGAVLGGLGSIPGAVIGSLLIGVAEELSLLALPPTYRSVIGFIAIVVVLTFRPQGLLGQKQG